MKLLRHARRGLCAAAIAMTAGCATAQPAPSLPPGMSFVAQDASGAWSLYRVNEQRQITRLPTQLEPRQACVSPAGDRLVYAAADGTVRFSAPPGTEEVVLARPDAQRAYTQPCLGLQGRDVVLVEMAGGKSLETEILRLAAGAEPQPMAPQPGAQQEPFVHAGRWLVYASAGCSSGCESPLVEIWGRDLLTGRARQLTLLNAFSIGPVTDGKRVLFSSNASGSFQLWQVNFDGGSSQQLTRETQHASQPALCQGDIYFVHSGPGGTVLAKLLAGGRAQELPLAGLKGFRSLRCL